MALIRDKTRASGYLATLAKYLAPTELYEFLERHRGILVQPFSRSRTVPRRCALTVLASTVFGFVTTSSLLSCAAGGRAAESLNEPVGRSDPVQLSSESVDEVTLEPQCFRCPKRYRVTFCRDGSATMISFALGRTSRATVTREEFNALATLLQREGFFDLSESYRNPELADGVWQTTTVVSGGFTKSVLNSNYAGPPKLVAIEEAIEALSKTVVWINADR